MKSIIFGFVLILGTVFPSLAQTNTVAPDTNAVAANPTPADQAPDIVLQKLKDLIDAGKYPEAQQMATGLLAAYPDDPRLTKAKALLDKMIAQQSAPAAPVASQPMANATPVVSPPATSSADQLTGLDKVQYNSLIELGREAQQTADLGQQKQLLQQFMDESGPFLQAHPDEILIWQIRAEVALAMGNAVAGYEAGQKLLTSPNADSDPTTQRLLSQLNIKGWLDKQKIDNLEKFGWLLGTWNVSTPPAGGGRGLLKY